MDKLHCGDRKVKRVMVRQEPVSLLKSRQVQTGSQALTCWQRKIKDPLWNVFMGDAHGKYLWSLMKGDIKACEKSAACFISKYYQATELKEDTVVLESL